jgi:uncharacterized membrane protein HdeD (DUF308 family)
MNEVKSFAQQMWWINVLQGLMTLALGVVALFWPGLTLVTLLYVVSAYAIIVGATDIVFSISSIKVNKSWWLMALGGVVLIGVAAFLLRNLDVALSTFAILVGLVFVVRGTLEVIASALGESLGNRVLIFAMGALSVVAGVVVWLYPLSGSLSFVWVLGLFAVIRGAVDIANASSLYHDAQDFENRAKKVLKG